MTHSLKISVNSGLMTASKWFAFFHQHTRSWLNFSNRETINLKKRESFGKQAISSSGVNSYGIFILRGNTEAQVMEDCSGSWNQQSLNDLASPRVLLPMETTCSVWMMERRGAEETPKHRPCRGSWVPSYLRVIECSVSTSVCSKCTFQTSWRLRNASSLRVCQTFWKMVGMYK